MLNSIFRHSGYLEKSLDAAWLRNEVTANNISNADTPNFKSSHVEFESILKDELESNRVDMKKTREGHLDLGGENLSSIEPKVVPDNDTFMRMDGNNVDMEAEQLNMVKNVIYYNSLIQKISEEFGRIKTAINEGK